MTQLASFLPYLPDDKRQELETVRETILQTGKAEMILLFGSYARGNYH